MSLILCAECGHEVATTAVACPNCGRPTHAPVPVEKKIYVAPQRESSFPPWAIVPIVILGLVLLAVGYMLFRQSDETANTNLNVSVAQQRRAATEPSRGPVTSAPSTVPMDVQSPSVPSQSTTVPSTSTSVPNAPPPDKGTVKITAMVAPTTGQARPARGTRFYLLDKDLESILSEARIAPIEGNSLAASLGLAAVFPDRYGDFQRAAMNAIKGHVKYSGTAGGSGNLDMRSVEPNSYYLFAIARVGRGFALWNQSVSVIAGDNLMNLSPQSVTEIPDPNGE